MTGSLAGSTAVAVATISPTSPFRVAEARYRAAEDDFKALPPNLETTDPAAFKRAEQAFIEAVEGVHAAPAADWEEFADAFEIATDGGVSLPNEELVMKLLRDVRRLSRKAEA